MIWAEREFSLGNTCWRLSVLNAILDTVDVGVADFRIFGDVRLERQEGSNLGARLTRCSTTRLEELGDVGVLAVNEREDVLRSLRGNRENASGQVVGQTLFEGAEKHLIEQGYGSPRVEV